MDMIVTVSIHNEWIKSSFRVGTLSERESSYRHNGHTIHVEFNDDVKRAIGVSVLPTQVRDRYIGFAIDAAEFVEELNSGD